VVERYGKVTIGYNLRRVAKRLRALRVFIGSSLQPVGVGDSRVTLREHNAQQRQMDVLIDCKAAVLEKVAGWAKTAAAASGHRVLLLDTDSPAYFRSVKQTLGALGYESRVISDCHFAVPLNHFIPGFLPNSVAVFRK
jgi:hypothetical protein